MNVFSLETLFTIEFIGMLALFVFGLIIVGYATFDMFPKSAIKKTSDRESWWDVLKPLPHIVGICMIVFSCVLCHDIYSESALADETYKLGKIRHNLEIGVCSEIKGLGCPAMWNRFRADSIYLESRLNRSSNLW